MFQLLSRRFCVLLFSFAMLVPALQAQQNCASTSTLAQGYSVSISNVTENANGTFTITLTVLNNGCSGCKKLNSFLVQAAPGTYSNVIVQVLYGPFTYANIAMGPTLSGTSLTGFRINNTNGMGNGQASAFTVTYTVTTLQNQQIQLKAGSSTLNNTFSIADFQAVLSCLNPPPPPPQVIFPYFDPYANKSYDIIGVELTSLYNKYANGNSVISDNIFQIIGNSVRVSIRTQPGQHTNAVNLLTGPSYGLIQELNDETNNLLNGTFPILNLLSLNLLPDLLVSARPIYSPINNAGLITSQGDTALRSFRARGVFGVDGTGTKVGVLSDSYNTIVGDPAADDVVRKDLPGPANPDHPNPVQVLQDFPLGTRTDEGRAMLQIVHDVAPGADLAFRTGFLGPVDFAKGIRDLKDAGCDVIVDDITYISEPFFRDGVVAQAVNEVKAQGVSYFSAAGNFGTNSWQGTFAPVAAPTGVVGQAHNFAGGASGTDIFQGITLYQGEYTIVFQWDDGTPGTATSSDFDIYLANTSGNTLFGFNRMNIGGDAFEVLPFVVTADSVQSNIVIVRESGAGSALLKYVVYRGRVTVNEYGGFNASTITGQANAAGAMAVGAVLYTNTPQYGVATPTPASFSSRGGTPVDGTNRFKPDMMAPNGVNTSVNLGGVNIDGDAFPNFFGTSAAAPHAAGVAALLIEARTKYYGDVLSPDGVKNILQTSAIDMGTPGYDVATGAGYITADNALSQLGNPAPFITSIYYDTTLTPGVDTILLTVYGEYLNEGATIWLDGAPLTNGVVIQGDSAIITIVQPFSGLYPAIQVYNPPMAGTNGTDGGLSNPLYFTTKETILVSVDDKSKKYGEVLPQFTAVYTLEGVNSSVPLASSELTPEEQARIQSIGITTIANSLSNVGLWGIEANSADPLSPNSSVPATSPLDISLLERYNVVFRNGVLTIDPADLKITARDTTIVYGEAIEGLNWIYELSDGAQGALNITPSDNQAIVSAVASTRGTALVNATGLVRGTALVNNDGEQLLTDDILNNFSFMISQAVASTRGTALVNGELVDPAELYSSTVFTNAEARLVRGTALVNGYTLVRGTALVNTIDSLGTITNTSSLTNAGSLVNSGGVVNSSAISLNSNTQTLVILGDEDVSILSGETPGEVVLRSVNLITGNTVGTHLILPGTFISNNFNISYGLGNLTILPATAQFTITPSSLTQTYNGEPRSVGVTVVPAEVPYTVTYNGDTIVPVDAGTYTVQVSVDDPNYVGSATATLVIQKGDPQISIASSLPHAGVQHHATHGERSHHTGRSALYRNVQRQHHRSGERWHLRRGGNGEHRELPGHRQRHLGGAESTGHGHYGHLRDQQGPGTAHLRGHLQRLPRRTDRVGGDLHHLHAEPELYQSGRCVRHHRERHGGQLHLHLGERFAVREPGRRWHQAGEAHLHLLREPERACERLLQGGLVQLRQPEQHAGVYPLRDKELGDRHLLRWQPTTYRVHAGRSAPIAIPYNGSSITWQLTSNKNNGTSGSIPANSSNTVCTSPGVKNLVFEETPTVTEVKVYPNPSTGRVFLEFPEVAADAALVEVYNAMGARCAVRVDRAADQRLELDLSANGQGMYIIQVLRDGNIESFRVIIE